MAKKPKLSRPYRKLQRTLLALIGTLLTSFFIWLTETTTQPQIPHSSNPVEIYATQAKDPLKASLISAIQTAKESVYVVVYGLTDSKLIHALRQKSEEGVLVKVIVDAKASPHIAEKLGPSVKLIKRSAKGLMHIKALVIDKQLVWLGSANFTGDSLINQGNLTLGFDHPQLAEYVIRKADSLDEYGRQHLLSNQKFQAQDQTIDLYFLPDNSKASLKIQELIRSAKKSIKVAMFTFTRKDFAQDLIDAKKRGVSVEVVLDKQSSRGTSAQIVQMLLKSKAAVRVDETGSLFHYKLLIIDDKTLVDGSANWTKAAFQENDDFFMIIDPLTEDQKTKLNKLWQIILKESSPLST